MTEQTDERLIPEVPAGAVVVIADVNGNYPDDRRFATAHMWTWLAGL